MDNESVVILFLVLLFLCLLLCYTLYKGKDRETERKKCNKKVISNEAFASTSSKLKNTTFKHLKNVKSHYVIGKTEDEDDCMEKGIEENEEFFPEFGSGSLFIKSKIPGKKGTCYGFIMNSNSRADGSDVKQEEGTTLMFQTAAAKPPVVVSPIPITPSPALTVSPVVTVPPQTTPPHQPVQPKNPTDPKEYSFSQARESKPFKQIDSDKNVACGVTHNDDIFCADNFDFSNWTSVPGKLKQVAVNDGKLYGVNSGNDIFYASDYKNAAWKKVGGSLKQVDFEGTVVCGVNSNDDIFCADNDLANPDWKKLPGSLKHVSVYNAKLLGINKNNNIYYASYYKNPDWQTIPGSLTQASVDDIVCGVNSNNDVFCSGNVSSPTWVQVPGKLTNVSVSNKGGTVLGVINSRMFTTRFKYSGPTAAYHIYNKTDIQLDQKLYQGQGIKNGNFMLVMQDDGNLVIYNTTNNTPVWATGTNEKGTIGMYFAHLRKDDGHFCVYDTNATYLWGNRIFGQNTALIQLTDNGKLNALNSSGAVLWTS